MAHVLYFADVKWWEWHRSKPGFQNFEGEKCTVFDSAGACDDPAVHMLRNAGEDGLSDTNDAVYTGLNSGSQIANVAAIAGAPRIVLVGYDARLVEGVKHFFGEHPDKSTPPFNAMVHWFNVAAPLFKARGIEVLNATPGSAIKNFPSVTLMEALS